MFSLIKKIVEEINSTEPVGDCKVYPITPIYASLLILYNSLKDESKKDLEVYFKDKEEFLDQIDFPMVTSLTCNQSIFTKQSINQLNLWNPLVDIKLIRQVLKDTFDTPPKFITYKKTNKDVNLINYMEYQANWNPKTIIEENNNNIYLVDKFTLFKMNDFDLNILKLPLENGDTLVLFHGINVTETLFANEQQFWKITMEVFENPEIKVSLLKRAKDLKLAKLQEKSTLSEIEKLTLQTLKELEITKTNFIDIQELFEKLKIPIPSLLKKEENLKPLILKLPVLHVKKTNAKLYSIKKILNKPLYFKGKITNKPINLKNVKYSLEFKLDQKGCNLKSKVGIKLSNIDFTYDHKPLDFTENSTYGIIYKQVTKKENKVHIPLFMFCFCENSQPTLDPFEVFEVLDEKKNIEGGLSEVERLMIEAPPQTATEAIWGDDTLYFKPLIKRLDNMTTPFNIWQEDALKTLYYSLKKSVTEESIVQVMNAFGKITDEKKPPIVPLEIFNAIWKQSGMSILSYIKKKGIIDAEFIDPYLVKANVGNIPKYLGIGDESKLSFLKSDPVIQTKTQTGKRRRTGGGGFTADPGEDKGIFTDVYIKHLRKTYNIDSRVSDKLLKLRFSSRVPSLSGIRMGEYVPGSEETSIPEENVEMGEMGEDIEMGETNPGDIGNLAFFRKEHNFGDNVSDEEIIKRLDLQRTTEARNSPLMDMSLYPNRFKNPISTKGAAYLEEEGPESKKLKTLLLNSIENKIFEGITPKFPLKTMEKNYVKLLMDEIPKTTTNYSKKDFEGFFRDYLLDGKSKEVVERLWKKYEKDITRKLQIEGLLKFGFNVSLINVNEELFYKTLRKSQITYTNLEKFTNGLIKRYIDEWTPTEVGNITWYVGVVKKGLLYIAYLEKFMVLRPHESIRKFLNKNKKFLNFREKYQNYKVWIKAIGKKVKIVDSLRVQLKNYWIAINKIIPFILREYTIAETGDLEKLGPITIYSEFDKGGVLGVRKLTMKRILSNEGFEKKYEAALRTYYTQIKKVYKMIVDTTKNEQPTTDGEFIPPFLIPLFMPSPRNPPTEEQVELKEMMMEIYRKEKEKSKKKLKLKIKTLEAKRKEQEAMTGEEMVITINIGNLWNQWKKYWGDRERDINLKRKWSKKEVKSIHKKYSELKNIKSGDNDLKTDGLVYRKPYRRRGLMWNRGRGMGIIYRRRRPVGGRPMVKYKKRRNKKKKHKRNDIKTSGCGGKKKKKKKKKK